MGWKTPFINFSQPDHIHGKKSFVMLKIRYARNVKNTYKLNSQSRVKCLPNAKRTHMLLGRSFLFGIPKLGDHGDSLE